ncbi:ATP-binding protein [Actinoplanes sp. NPDC051851]|uniref:sensor histidine kinase n=1 Tax=Actinoplanes sp. NPDC051851 TaxID=3154753 RepID=UPI003423974B
MESFVDRFEWWAAVALAIAVAAVRVGAAYRAGRVRAAYRAGRAAEQAHWLRLLHDTALQSLEAMALDCDSDRDAPAEALRRVRASARREALILRGNLALLATPRPRGTRAAPPGPWPGGGPEGPWPGGGPDGLWPGGGPDGLWPGGGPDGPQVPGTLVGALSAVAGDLPVDGPRVEVVGVEPAVALSDAGRDVLRDAARAALGNAVRHAGAGRIVVRVAESAGGVAVVVRDDGRGFDPRCTEPGFGIRQSITERVREAGGTATVESAPGRGTRVRLWIPERATTRHLLRR